MPSRTGLGRLVLVPAIAGLLTSGPAFAGPLQGLVPQPAAAAQSSTGENWLRNTESITGTISLVKPREGLIVVTKRGPGQPPMLVIKGATVLTHNPDGTTTKADVGVTASMEPGETSYSFRVTSSTVIRVNGRSVNLGELTPMYDRKATVRFSPKRNGNFASSIDVRL